LNTDGIDPSGRNIYIKNVTITNFDDAVAVKPANGGYKVATCAQNITVENAIVNWGVGMTIGSVPPH
jgi:polygalacturonase